MNLQLLIFVLIVYDSPHLRHVVSHRTRHHRNQNRANGASKNHVRDVYDIDNETWMRNSPRYESIDGVETDELKKGKYSIINESQQKSNALFPSLIDVASSATITANATCGTTGDGSDETYCRLGNALQCGVCNDIMSEKRHPISYATDSELSTWWQSPTLEQGSEYEHVAITMDLKQEYYVWYVIVKCAISPRPANWILERSIDGSHFSVWQYFFANEEDCWQYGLQTTNTAAKVTSATDNETLCSTYYSKLQPLENGEIHAFIAKSRAGCVSNCSIIGTDALREFSRARYIRFRFQKLNFPKDKSASLTDPSFQRRLFYSVKKISVGAQCICHGHASRCKRSQDLYPQCECKHHTCGSNCEYCCPLYNQKPWMEATLSGSSVCEQCQCHGHATACQYDAHVAANNASINIRGEYVGGGVCINCTKHTTGINCEKCETGWYRPSGVLPSSDEPCLPCDCFPDGSLGHCVSDDPNNEVNGQKPGTCICLENFTGPKCDKCAMGYSNFPNCDKCECDSRGTLQSQSCEEECLCKEKVEGKTCNQCKKGYFGLSASNPAGCIECYCSGLSTICSEATGYRLQTIHNLTNWIITNSDVTKFTSPNWDSERKVFYVDESEMQSIATRYHWLAPKQYLGNKLTSYGSAIRIAIEWIVQRGDTSGKPVFNPDIIIVGKNGLNIAHGNKNYMGSDKMMLSVRLSDTDWYHLDDEWKASDYSYSPLNDERRVSRREMLSVLADIKHILLRAKFHTDQVECSLVDVELETGIEDAIGERPIISSIEKCQCPLGYTGLSCEQCDYGFVPQKPDSEKNQLICAPCGCNGHSPSCDLNSGHCDICEHNTTGSKCERCLDGFYGNAQVGKADDCKVCACPLLEQSNNFSPTCELKYSSTNEYICTKCLTGYSGDHCEKCDEGYFGDPVKIGSTCKPCDCGGNPCNQTTGQCLKCEGNTEGWYCEQCKEGYYGKAAEKNCSRCDCNTIGSENNTSCDIHSGQCLCKMNYIGRKCDKCLDGFGDFPSGCPPCQCNILGSENEICDSTTGHCPCKVGVTGRFCDRCVQNFYSFEGGQGCISCSCDKIGSLNEDCDDITGQCNCKDNVAGRTCNQCKDKYWGLTETGCSLCDCDATGSLSQTCDFISGQCTCKFGVTGRKCDLCQKNFYGFSKFGCFECEKCKQPGHICDTHSGRCVCPHLTEGPTCNKCVQGAYNYQSTHGCQECKCDKHGSISNVCNQETGQCFCRIGFSGDKCNLCATGYYGFPKCRPCLCNLAGSDPETCFDNHCLCDNGGNCYCKANTGGRKCDRCKEGTFGLHHDNAGGCTACFCFGRSTQCTEAGLTWSHIKLRPDRMLTVHYDMSNNTNISSTDIYPVDTQEICFINLALPNQKSGNATQIGANSENGMKLNVINNLRLIPGFTGDVGIGVNYLFDAPVYWQLPNQFLGDRVLSYGGFIEFTVDTEGERTLLPPAVISSYPLIQMQGNGRFIIEYFPPLISADKRHRVRLHESLWKLKNNPTGHVSRELFMLTLQNLQHILIRASKSIDFTKATLSGVIMDFAAKNEDILPSTTSLTHGIELCECPSQYSSSSCQNPSIGYYRYFENNRTVPVSTIIIDVIGEAAKCECNGLSTVCDINTGTCQNCSKNTGGAHCENCAEGYYKSEVDGECKPCPCPSTVTNHAYTCHVPTKHEESGVLCLCQTGYKGKICDRCDYGWYGYPRQINGTCKPCNCNPYGSISDECHEETGQCNCKADSTGRDCSSCLRKKHVLTSKGCTLCTDACVQMLLDTVDAMSANLTDDSNALINVKLKPPWHLLANTNENVTRIQQIFDATNLSSQQLLARGFTAEEELRKKVKNTINKIKRLGKQLQNLNISINFLTKNATIVTNLSSLISEKIKTIVGNLEKYIYSKKVDLNLSTVVGEARFLLNNIKDLDNTDQLDKVEKILSICRITFDTAQNYENSGPGLHMLKRRVEKLNERIDDLGAIVANVTSEIDQINRFTGQNNDKLRWIANITQQVNDILLNVRKLQEPLKLQDETLDRSIGETNGNLQNLRYHLTNLMDLNKMVEKKEGILFDLNSRYMETYKIPAHKHAETLWQQAQHYVSLFSATKHDADIAMRASKAYKNIVDALFDAQYALNDANDILKLLSDRLQSKPGQNSVVDVAHTMEEISRQLKTQATIELLNVDSLQKQYEYRLLAVDFSEKQLMEITQNVSRILQQIAEMNRSGDKFEDIVGVLEKYWNVTEIPDSLYDSIFSIQDNIHEELKPKLNKLLGYGDVGLRPADEFKIKEAEEATENMVSQLKSTQKLFLERSKYFEKWNSSVDDQLDELRNKIEEAKHLANGIHLSLSSKNDQELCTRSYQSKFLKPSITNYISMTYAISSSHRDALLFYLAGSSSGDFLAVEMINRKIRFIWDLGGGAAEVTHHLHIQTAGDLQKDQHWYKIDAERIGNVGKLSVRPVIVPPGSMLTYSKPVTNSSAPGWNRFDVSSNDNIWIGGANKPSNSILLSKQTGLIGCLYSVFFDSRQIGLWNFKAESVTGCGACVEGAEEVREDDSYFFTGDGYSSLPGHSSTVYNKYFFSVAFDFRTFDENAILFYAAAANDEQYISVTMKDGRILFQIGYTEEINLEIRSSHRYATGNWTRVEAARYYDRKKKTEKGVLKVGGETKEGMPEPIPRQSDIPDLTMPHYFFGGVPPGFKTSFTLPQSFLGCMSDLQVLQEVYNPMKGAFWGIQKGCSDKPVTVAGFKGNGYIELQSYPLKKSSSFSFVFSTNQPNTFLMLSTTEGLGGSAANGESSNDNEDTGKVEEINYYSVSLHEGRIELIVNAGSGDTRLKSKMDTNYSDGQLHSLTLIKTSKRLELRIDDVIQAIGFMEDEGSSIVRASGIGGGLFFGGFPSDLILNVSLVSHIPLVGTIKDAIFNDHLIHFEKLIEFEEALIGRMGPQTQSSDWETQAQNTEGGINSCHNPKAYSAEPTAMQFGEDPNSYVRLDYLRQAFHGKNSTIKLSFRTFYTDGILLVIPAHDEKPLHFVKVFLQNNRINVQIKNKRVQHEMSYNDGKWHQIKITREGKMLSLVVDDSPARKKEMVPKKMTWKNVIYVGGYSSELSLFPSSTSFNTESLKGCIKDVIVNGKMEDLVGERAIHHKVDQCFTKIEMGAHFTGDGYSVVANNHHIGRSLNFELEFRTSELNGVLMSISEPQGYPALSLELNRGKILLNGDMGDRRPFKIEQEFSTEFHLCDNEWHHVKIVFLEEEITLFVDDQSKMYWLSDNGHITEAETNSVFYIGGLPENAPMGTLESKDGFKGCIRNVMIGGQTIEWSQFSELKRVFTSSCPVP